MKLYSTLYGSVLLAANTGSEGGSGDALDNVKANTAGKFKETLKKFKSSITSAQKYARELTNMALEHFAAHGDLVYAQAFSDACKGHANNFVRHVAFVEWMTTFSPATYEKGKWVKDKERAEKIEWPATPIQVEMEIDGKTKLVGYADVSFWDFMPEKEIVKLSADELLAFFMGKANSKKLAERVAGDPDAEATLAKLKATLADVKAVHIQPAEVQTAAAA